VPSSPKDWFFELIFTNNVIKAFVNDNGKYFLFMGKSERFTTIGRKMRWQMIHKTYIF